MLYIILIISLIFVSIIAYTNYQQKKQEEAKSQRTYEQVLEQEKEKINKELNSSYQSVLQTKQQVEKEKEKLDQQIATNKKVLSELTNTLEITRKTLKTESESSKELMEENLKEHYKNEETRYREELNQAISDLRAAANKEFNCTYDEMNQQLNGLLAKIDEYQKIQNSINEDIMRRREMEEKEEFYRIQLDDNLKKDIEVLNSIRQQLNKVELLDKLIYENYVARPAKEMIKRVLGGRNPSGIYKVTNTKTNEIYIGKSVKIADRFSNHIKSACGLEGVAESQFQRALKKYGIDMFTWELLEECPKENLGEREKYYIVFYGTKEYGYNQREG